MKLMSYYANVELFKVISENSRPRGRLIDLRLFLSSYYTGRPINLALRFLSLKASGGVLALTDEVMSQLKQKHPNPQSAKLVSLRFGPIDDHYLESVYTEITREMVRQAALRTKGAGSPSGVDANGFRKSIACKSLKQSLTRLCEAIATIIRTLCRQLIL